MIKPGGFFFSFKKILFFFKIWLQQVLVTARGIFSGVHKLSAAYRVHVCNPSSLTKS